MAGSSFFALLDDIATLLDDVAVLSKIATKNASAALDDVATLTKVATQKTAGVLGDDLALNAEQVAGVLAERELPVVLAVAKGSAINKVILVPAALAISAIVPWAVTPVLMLGGGFLCYEGFEKVAHKVLHPKKDDESHHAGLIEAIADPAVDLVAFEKDKIRGAVRTDFILSAEIVVIALGTVATSPLATRVGVLVSIAMLMTVGVYGLVAVIVKLDDLGLNLSRRGGAARRVGLGILAAAPWLMKGLSVAGTAAMFLVGGGIITHGVPFFHHFVEELSHGAGLVAAVAPTLLSATVGIVVGGLLVAFATVAGRLRARAT
jgi:predicted DNA repair protein MutK